MLARIAAAAAVFMLVLVCCQFAAGARVVPPAGFCWNGVESGPVHLLDVCAAVSRADPCLAHIIDREDGTWSPTVNYGGGHGDVDESYGLGQADPGYKMAGYGRRWATSVWVQLRWAVAYARGRYGGVCQAWSSWQQHDEW